MRQSVSNMRKSRVKQLFISINIKKRFWKCKKVKPNPGNISLAAKFFCSNSSPPEMVPKVTKLTLKYGRCIFILLHYIILVTPNRKYSCPESPLHSCVPHSTHCVILGVWQSLRCSLKKWGRVCWNRAGRNGQWGSLFCMHMLTDSDEAAAFASLCRCSGGALIFQYAKTLVQSHCRLWFAHAIDVKLKRDSFGGWLLGHLLHHLYLHRWWDWGRRMQGPHTWRFGLHSSCGVVDGDSQDSTVVCWCTPLTSSDKRGG